MHICFITSEYPKKGYPHGGIGTFVQTISHHLTIKGHKVSVVGINTYTNANEVIEDGLVNIYRLKPKILKGLTWYFNSQIINKKLMELQKLQPIDIVETAEMGLAFINKIQGVKYLIRLHGGHHFFSESEKRKVSWWKGFQEHKSFKNADAFIAVSKYVKSHTSKYLSYHNKPIKIIRYPINLKIFKPRTDIDIVNKSILFAGTVCEKKGIKQLIKAMPKVIEKHAEAQLYVYGRDWYFSDGRSYIKYLKHEVLPQLGNLSKHIHFMEALPLTDLAIKYASAEVCVFPSLMETQGLVAPEAMAVEKLVVFSECGPGPETINHKTTGLLCNPYNTDDIANKILWAFNNKTEAKEIAKSARASVLINFNIDTIVNKNLEFYKFVKNQ